MLVALIIMKITHDLIHHSFRFVFLNNTPIHACKDFTKKSSWSLLFVPMGLHYRKYPSTMSFGCFRISHDDIIKRKHFPRYWPLWGEFTFHPSHRPVRRSFDAFFDLRLNIRLSKQSRRWWFETPWRSSWRHCNVYIEHTPFDVNIKCSVMFGIGLTGQNKNIILDIFTGIPNSKRLVQHDTLFMMLIDVINKGSVP